MSTAQNKAGGSLVAALTVVDGGVKIIVGEGKPKNFPITGELNAENLADKLGNLPPEKFGTILLVGTRSDGTAGWDGVDADGLKAATSHNILWLTEAAALHSHLAQDGKQAGYIILANNVMYGGSARWFVQAGDGVMIVNVQCVSVNNELFTISGPSITATPSLLGAMVGDFLKQNPTTTQLHVWSQGGIDERDYGPDNRIFWGMSEEFEGAKRTQLLFEPEEALRCAIRGATPKAVTAR